MAEFPGAAMIGKLGLLMVHWPVGRVENIAGPPLVVVLIPGETISKVAVVSGVAIASRTLVMVSCEVAGMFIAARGRQGNAKSPRIGRSNFFIK